ncbi:MAG TPA: hypothetical protein VF695_12700 [Sphingomonas sp.]|jgi:hypothetical protein
MAADAKTLARIHRVRTVQLHQAHAAEARVREQAAAEEALGARIAALADAVAPTRIASSGIALGAAALYRDKLHQSAHAAVARLARTQAEATRAAAVTRAARQDQNAVEKLMDRARLADAAADRRKLEDLPTTPGARGRR